MAAFEAGELDRDQVGMAGGELGGPELVIGTGRKSGLPHVGDLQRIVDDAGADLVAEEPVEQVSIEIRVHGQGALRKDRVAELLKLRHDLVVDAGVMMIGAPQHHDSQSVFGLELVEDFAAQGANSGFKLLLFAESNGDSAIVFLFAEAQYRLPG